MSDYGDRALRLAAMVTVAGFDVEYKHYPPSYDGDYDRHYVLVREVGKPDVHYDTQYHQQAPFGTDWQGTMSNWNPSVHERLVLAQREL